MMKGAEERMGRAPGVLARLRGFLPGGNGTKAATPESGVQFVGPAGNIVRLLLDNAPRPEAPRLTRDMAFVTSAYCFVAMRLRAAKVAEPPLMIVR